MVKLILKISGKWLTVGGMGVVQTEVWDSGGTSII